MEPVAIATSDWHINNFNKIDRRFDVEFDFEYSLFQIAQYLNQYKVPLFLLGDIFDKEVINGVAIEKILYLDSHLKYDTPCYFILGQHDPKNPNVLDKIKTQRLFFNYMNRKELDIYDVRFAFLDYVKKYSQELLSFMQEDTKILLTHQVFEDFIKYATSGWSLFHLPENLRLVISGDYHKACQKYLNRGAGLDKRNINYLACRLVSCGSIVFTDFNHQEHIRQVVGLFKSSRLNYYCPDFHSVSVCYLPLKTRIIKKIKIFDHKNAHDSIDKLRKLITKLHKYRDELPEKLKHSIYNIHIDYNLYKKYQKELSQIFDDYDLVTYSFFSSVNIPVYGEKREETISIKNFGAAVDKYCEIQGFDQKVSEDSMKLWTSYNIDNELDKIIKSIKQH